MNAEQKEKYNEYMRNYMNEKRKRQRNKKKCLDCKIREVEYRHRFCSECGQLRLDISNDISKHNQMMRKKQNAKTNF